MRGKGGGCRACQERAAAQAKMAKLAVGEEINPTNRWLDSHPEALDFLETWLEMAISGQTDWGMRQVHRELVDLYGLPFRDPTSFGRRLRDRYGKRYDDAVKERRWQRR